MEEREEGILLRPLPATDMKLSWEDTAHDMAEHNEGWGSLDGAASDGLEQTPWAGAEAAEPKPGYSPTWQRKVR